MSDEQLELPLDWNTPDPIRQVYDHYPAIAAEVYKERVRQIEKWGLQDHQFFSGSNKVFTRLRYERGAEDQKRENSLFVDRDDLGWDTILFEEVYEALAEAGVDDVAYEKELVEVMAVAAAMIEANRRRRGA
jgi:hypothetical protein